MPRSDPIQLRVAAVAKMSDTELRKALKDKSNLVTAKAAEIIAKRNLTTFAADLAAAFHRFMENDKGCFAKTAIIKTLYEFGHTDEPLYLTAIRHTQPEPVWGGQSDAAGQLRGYAALALVRTASRRALEESLRLLVDPDIQARIMGVRAVAYHHSDPAMLLLRLKALAGDNDINVTAETFSALVRNWPNQSVDFVAEFLRDHPPEIRTAALSTLAESRTEQAFTIFKTQYTSTIDPTARREALSAIATLRRESAIEFLLHLIRDESAGEACEALSAMESFATDPAILAKISAAVKDRDELRVTEKFSEIFGK